MKSGHSYALYVAVANSDRSGSNPGLVPPAAATRYKTLERVGK
jgi:hypothetical protein